MWIDTDIAIPAFDKQIVRIKVADFTENYVTEGYYNHREQVWYDKNGHCLNDNVYKWLSDNQPDMREKVREYISELDAEYDRCMDWIQEHMNGEACQVSAMEMRAKTLNDVKNDLQNRLDELV